jgi:hypothetical protein
MHFVVSRYLALLFAIGLAIGETIISWGHWQFAPLWFIDYLTAAFLLYAYFKTRQPKHLHILLAAWAFSAGVFYMDLFVNLDPQVPANLRPNNVVMALIVLVLALSLIGFVSALLAIRAEVGGDSRVQPS